MPRNRNLYQSNALFVGPSPASGQFFSSGNSGANLVLQLHRVQTNSFDFNVAREDTFQFSQLAALSKEIIEPPTVNYNFSYLVTNVYNEVALGMALAPSGLISKFLTKEADEKNYFTITAPEGFDAANYVGSSGDFKTVGVSNGTINSYAVEAAVGGLPTATVGVEGLNFVIYQGVSGVGPAINPSNGARIASNNFLIPPTQSGLAGQVPTLRPGDVELNLGLVGVGVDLVQANIQSVNFSIDLSRESLQRLGSRFAFAKEITVPINATMSVNANVSDLTTGSLSDVFCNDQSYNLTVNLRKPSCSGFGPVAYSITMKNAKLDSQSFSQDVGNTAGMSVDLTFTASVGGAGDQVNGLFLSGLLV